MNLPDFSQASILVAGDVMLDRYYSGSTDRISPEAPVPVVKQSKTENRLGGAANVALNLSVLGSRANLSGLLGHDEAAQSITTLLAQHDIGASCLQLERFETITKLRVMSRNQQLLRIDTETDVSEEQTQALLTHNLNLLNSHQALVLSDYNKGAIAQPEALIKQAATLGIPVLVDPKGQDYKKYTGASVLTPNKSELEQIVGSWQNDAELQEKAEALRQQLQLQALLVTLSERGMMLLEAGQEPLYLPAQARDVYDVTGAGDTVIAVMAACIASGLSMAKAAYIANTAAAIVVGKLGTASVLPEELNAALDTVGQHQQSVVSEAELLEKVKLAKAASESLVMTNGCFDLLHPGHLAYLQEAAALGDRLIIAVNSDASVQGLKGPSRPINTLADRMQMLAAIKGVDWVVAFDEDTPQQLITKVLPDVLVKGGDYLPEQIAGYKEVTANGGSVKILSFLEGYSSSALIEKIKQS